MAESSGTVSSSSSQDNYSVDLYASFHISVDEPIEREHKERICRRAAIATACHIEAKEDSKWEDFSAKLAFEIYSAIKDKKITAGEILTVNFTKFANNVVFTEPPRQFYGNVCAQVYVEIDSKRYQISYALDLKFIFHQNNSIDYGAPKEQLMLTPPPNFSAIVRQMRKALFIAELPQLTTDLIEKNFESLIKFKNKGTVELSVYVKLNLPDDSPIHPDDKDIVAQRFALIVGIFLEYIPDTKEDIQMFQILKDLSLHSAWKLFLLLRSLNYSTWVNEGGRVNLDYESDITCEESFPRRIALNEYRRPFSITTNNKIYPLTFRMKYSFTPLAISKTEDVLLADQELDAPPQQFRDVVNEIKNQSFDFKCLSTLNIKKLSMVVDEKCRYAVTN